MTHRLKVQCGAYARSTGLPCRAQALANGRCRCHGGCSTGPRTPEGRRAVGEATRQRMASGQRERVLAGFRRWLEGGGREHLAETARARFAGKTFGTHRAGACGRVMGSSGSIPSGTL